MDVFTFVLIMQTGLRFSPRETFDILALLLENIRVVFLHPR